MINSYNVINSYNAILKKLGLEIPICDLCEWEIQDDLTRLITGGYRCKSWFNFGKCNGEIFKFFQRYKIYNEGLSEEEE